MGEGGVDRPRGSGELGDADHQVTDQSGLFVGDDPALRACVPCVREPDVLSVETGLAVSFVALLSDAFGPVALSVASVGGGAECCHDHGSGRN